MKTETSLDILGLFPGPFFNQQDITRLISPTWLNELGYVTISKAIPEFRMHDAFRIKTPREIAETTMKDILKPWHSCEVGIKLLDARQKIPVTMRVYEREGHPFKKSSNFYAHHMVENGSLVLKT